MNIWARKMEVFTETGRSVLISMQNVTAMFFDLSQEKKKSNVEIVTFQDGTIFWVEDGLVVLAQNYEDNPFELIAQINLFEFQCGTMH